MTGRGNTSHAEVSSAHPELTGTAAERVTDSLRAVAQGYGSDVSSLVAETVRAESSSAAGNNSTP